MSAHANGVGSTRIGLAKRLKYASLLAPALAPMMLVLPCTPVMAAEITLPPISIGAGARSSFTSVDVDGANDKVNDFNIETARLYITGSATDTIKFTFNTEYNPVDESVIVMDAIARFEFAPEFNIWAGRLLPPSDRSNLYGPYYANHWGVYVDGVQDGYDDITIGRNDGVAYWGDFDKLKISVGLFDNKQTNSGNPDADKVVAAGRVQYDFWDKESGYWLNSTYYGEKDLLAIGVAAQTAGGDTSWSADFLLEKKLSSGGVITVESEYAYYEGITSRGGAGSESDGVYGLLSYLFPQPIGIGKLQLLGKYAEATFVTPGADPKLTTLEGNIGYIVKAFNVRGYLFYIDQSWDNSANADRTYGGIGLQIQI